MNIEEIRKKRRQLEKEIYDKIVEFCKETGVGVDSIRVYKAYEAGKHYAIVTDVEVEIVI